MAPSLSIKQRMTCNSYLFQKLLNLQDGISPFTLVIDSLEQSSIPVMKDFGRRAKVFEIPIDHSSPRINLLGIHFISISSQNKKEVNLKILYQISSMTADTNIIFISFATPRRKIPIDFTVHIKARGKALSSLQREALSYLKLSSSNACIPKSIIIIDTLVPLASCAAEKLPSFLNSLLASPAVSLIGIYHVDIPLMLSESPYPPNPLTTLIYLATAVLTVSSLKQTISRKQAKDKSLPEPKFGLEEKKEGILIGIDGPKKDFELVVNMDLRRRSGRGIREDFVLKSSPSFTINSSFILLENHPDYASLPVRDVDDPNNNEGGLRTTFNLKLTEKQKKDREEVILPYYDAQKEGGYNGPGEGGRILYQMGSEDREDFDEEEDEL